MNAITVGYDRCSSVIGGGYILDRLRGCSGEAVLQKQRDSSDAHVAADMNRTHRQTKFARYLRGN